MATFDSFNLNTAILVSIIYTEDYKSIAMTLLWRCYEVAMTLLWLCYDVAMTLLWRCYDVAMLLWCCYVAMMLLWCCYDVATTLLLLPNHKKYQQLTDRQYLASLSMLAARWQQIKQREVPSKLRDMVAAPLLPVMDIDKCYSDLSDSNNC